MRFSVAIEAIWRQAKAWRRLNAAEHLKSPVNTVPPLQPYYAEAWLSLLNIPFDRASGVAFKSGPNGAVTVHWKRPRREELSFRAHAQTR